MATGIVRLHFAKATRTWHGWHALRRGLGTNLYRLGVSDKVIQRILRHANVSTTLAFYAKTPPTDAMAAMQKLADVMANNRQTPVPQTRVS